MKETKVEEIVRLAEAYTKEGTPWHHHFLTAKCMFNKSAKFRIILENEESGEAFVALFDKTPMGELELLENLFFRRKK